ncbi:cytochrome P450 [Gilbertella persicaria]|uniref:cytochrome P450 n=1 Tax=Gilbertella persicaria TaxID=101096 RepID=UPI00221EAA36|nr:cytochrome P450 [Gilbertella persicaria]KAI8079517.1 cytochrome P450 [Gilbertella persicaria]
MTQSLVDVYRDTILPRLTQRNKAIGIGLAVALTFLYYVQDRLLKPPKQFRHLPYQSYFELIQSVIQKESYWDRAYRTVMPKIDTKESCGLYMKPARVGWLLMVTNPKDVKQILLKSELYPKLDISRKNERTFVSKFIGGNSMLLVNGEKWKSQRKVANPAFHRSAPVKLFGSLTQQLFEVIEENDSSRANVGDLMERWTLDAIGKAGFGFDFNALSQKDNAWVQTYNTINRGLQSIMFFLFPVLDTSLLWLFPKRQAMHRELNRFLDMLNAMIVHKREQIENGDLQNKDLEENEKDLLTLMIESEKRGEGILSNQELQTNICLFFLAGHDTTSNTLSFAMYYLATHPDIQQKAREEAIRVLGDAPMDIIPTIDQAKQFDYINQVIKETLRINGPVVGLVPRIATQDTFLSNTFIPKGTPVSVDIFGLQHSNKVWEHPEVFDPDRFSKTGEASVREAGEGMAYVPFSNGSRQCIGMNFSLYEQRVILSMLLRKYTWTLPKDSIHKDKLLMQGNFIIGPYNLEIDFKKRY